MNGPGAGGELRVVLAREEIALAVDDRDILRLEALDASGDHVRDGGDIGPAEAIAGLQSQDDGGGGLTLLRGEQTLLRIDDVDPGVGDAVDHLDALGQFILQGPAEIDVLDERADADLLVVEQLVSVLFPGRQTFLGQVQSKLVDVFLGHVDGGAAVPQQVHDSFLGDLVGDLGGFARGQILVEHPHVGAARPLDQQRPNDGRGRQDGDQQCPLDEAHLLPDGGDFLQDFHQASEPVLGRPAKNITVSGRA